MSNQETKSPINAKPTMHDNLKALKPVHLFSFGFVFFISVGIIFYALIFGIGKKQVPIETFVDFTPSVTHHQGKSASKQHQELMEELYEEERQRAEDAKTTYVPPIPAVALPEDDDWIVPGAPDNPLKDKIPDTMGDVPTPEDALPPILDLGLLNTTKTIQQWEPLFENIDINGSSNQASNNTNSILEERIDAKLTAIAALISRMDSDAPSEHLPQRGNGPLAATSASSNTSDQVNNSGPAKIPATSRFLCRTTYRLNNKINKIPLVEAECKGGIFDNRKITGTFTSAYDSLSIVFTKLHIDGHTIPIKGYPIDPKTKVIGLASSVDKHTLSRHLALISASFLEGIGALVDTTSITIGGNTVATESSYDSNARLVGAANSLGGRYATKAEEYYNTVPTVNVREHQEFTLMIVEDVPASAFPTALVNK